MTTWINSNDLLRLCMDGDLNYSSLWFGIDWLIDISWLLDNHRFWNLIIMLFT